MGVVRNLFDGLTNALTGAGTTTDPRSYNSYHFRRLTDPEIERAYRSGWVMRKLIDKPATEMVREWRDWQADKADVALIEKLERFLDLRNKVKRAEILRGLGGAGMVIYNGDADVTQPIDPVAVRQGTLKSVVVYHRSRFTLGPMITDPASPWCGHPSFYQLNTTDTSPKLHPSRVAAFRGDAVPDMVGSNWQDQWWGDSKVQTVLDAVQNSDTAQNGFAALIKDSRNRRLAVPGLTQRIATSTGETQFQNRVRALAMGESMFGVTFLDAGGEDGKGGETLTDRQMVWAGIPDIAAMYLAAAAGAADMPATVLLGKSPDGMNATGDGDRLIWENTIKARQDLDLRPRLDQLDAVLIPSALGRVDDDIWYKFAPLSTLNEKDEATAFWNTMQAMEIAQGTGTIPPVAFDKGMQNLLIERGWVPGIDAALAEVPEGERFPSEMADPADDTDPSALAIRNGGKEVDPNLAGGAGADGRQPPVRRAANDAATLLRDAGFGNAADALLAEVGKLVDTPFADSSEGEPRDDRGRWTVGSAIREHVTRALRSGKEHSTTSLGKVSPANAAKVRTHTGVNLSGHERVLQSSDIRHVFNSHGDDAKEAARGQVAVRKADFAHIPEIVEAAHQITVIGQPGSRKLQRLEYTAHIGGHEYRYMEEIKPLQVVALKAMRKVLVK